MSGASGRPLGLEYSQPHSHRHGQEPSVTIHAQPLMGRLTLTLQTRGHIRHPALFSGFTTLYLERPAPALVPHKAGTPRGPQLWRGVLEGADPDTPEQGDPLRPYAAHPGPIRARMASPPTLSLKCSDARAERL